MINSRPPWLAASILIRTHSPVLSDFFVAWNAGATLHALQSNNAACIIKEVSCIYSHTYWGTCRAYVSYISLAIRCVCAFGFHLTFYLKQPKHVHGMVSFQTDGCRVAEDAQFVIDLPTGGLLPCFVVIVVQSGQNKAQTVGLCCVSCFNENNLLRALFHYAFQSQLITPFTYALANNVALVQTKKMRTCCMCSWACMHACMCSGYAWALVCLYVCACPGGISFSKR